MFELLIVISWSSPFTFLPTLGLSELRMGFGTGEKLSNIPIHDICPALENSRYLAFPLYAIKWCSTTSHFLGCGNTIARAACQNTSGITETLLVLTNEQSCSSLSMSRSGNDLWLSCVVRGVVWLWSMNLGTVFYMW